MYHPGKSSPVIGELPEGLRGRGRLRGFKYSAMEEQAGMVINNNVNISNRLN